MWLAMELTILGRDPGHDRVIDDAALSRQPARLTLGPPLTPRPRA